MYTLTEITDALKVIKNVCNKHYHCEDCPLRNERNACAVAEDAPGDWKLYEPEKIKLIL